MSEVPTFDDVASDTKQSSSGSTGSSGPTIPEIPEGVAGLIIDAVEQKGGLIEIPAFSDDAPDFKETYAEHYDLDDVETMSAEDLFGYDWDEYDYIGTPPVTNSDSLTDDELDVLTDDEKYKSDGDLKAYVIKPKHAETFRGANVLKGGTTPISKAINGRFGDLVADTFGEDSKLSVGKGKKRNSDGDPAEAMTKLAFWVSDSDTAPKQRKKAQKEAGEITEEDYEEWLEANGFGDEL